MTVIARGAGCVRISLLSDVRVWCLTSSLWRSVFPEPSQYCSGGADVGIPELEFW